MLLRNVELFPNYDPEDRAVHGYRGENLNATYIYQFLIGLQLHFRWTQSAVANGIALKTPEDTVGSYFCLWTDIHLAENRHQWLVIVREFLKRPGHFCKVFALRV